MFVYLALKFQEIFREVYHSFRYKTVTSDFYFKSSNLKLVHGIKEKLQTFTCEKLETLLLFLLLKNAEMSVWVIFKIEEHKLEVLFIVKEAY